MRTKHLIVTLLIVVGLVGVAGAVILWARRPAVLYEVTFLTTADGQPILPHAINERGQVVGLVETLDRQQHIVLWDREQGAQDLGPYRIEWLNLLHMNDAGQVLVQVVDPNGALGTCLRDPNGQERRWNRSGRAGCKWYALNNRGQLAGCVRTSTGAMHAALWDPSTGARDLGTLGGTNSLARSINDKGQVAGFSDTAGQVAGRTAFFWDPNTGLQNLGPKGMGYGKRVHVNERGQVVGAFDVGGSPPSVSFWSRVPGRRPAPVLKKSFGAEVVALNDANQLLLQAHSTALTVKEEYSFHHTEDYLWDPGEGFVLLRRHLGCRDIRAFRARDLNNRGQIVGELELWGSKRIQGVLLEPVPKGGKKR